jgi:hypothetical protein
MTDGSSREEWLLHPRPERAGRPMIDPRLMQSSAEAGAERQLLGCRMGSYQLFQHLALVGHLGEGLASSN